MIPVEDEQGPLVGGTEVGDIYYVWTNFCSRMLDLRQLDEEVRLVQMFRRPVEHLCVHQRRSRSGKGLLRRHFM